MKFTRGFSGRAHAERDPRLPPGQYDTGHSWPVLTAEVTPKLDTASWTFAIEGLVETADDVDVGRDPRAPAVGATTATSTASPRGRSSGCSGRACRSTRCSTSRARSPSATHVLAFSHTGYTTNLPLADVTGGKAWVAWEADGEPLTRDHGGPARLLVPHLYFWKSAKWVAGSARARSRRARLLGAQRLPRPRRPLARAAVPGRLSVTRLVRRATAAVESRAVTTPWQTATRGRRFETRPPRTKTFRLALDEPARASRRPALRGAPDRARRLHRVALVLGRVAARRRVERVRAHGRAARRGRGLDVPARRRGGR